MGTNLRSYAKVRFFTKDNTIILDSATADGGVMSVTTQKDLSDSTNTFNITLSPRISKSQLETLGTVYLPDLIKPYDLVEISFKTDKNDYKVEMIGFVSRACLQINVVSPGGTPQRILEISGFGMSKALQMAKIFFNPYTQKVGTTGWGPNVWYATQKVEDLLSSVNVSTFVHNFVRQFFTNIFDPVNNPYFSFVFGGRSGYNYETGKPISETQGIKIPDLINFNSGMSTLFTKNKMNNPFILLDMGAGKEVSVWDVVKSYSDPPFHECFIDLVRPDFEYTEDGRSQILTESNAENINFVGNPAGTPPLVFYLRTTPFSPDTWRYLTSHKFSKSDIISQNTATSEDNIFNYYTINAINDATLLGIPQLSTMSAMSEDASLGRAKIPIFDKDSILKYGLRQFPVTTTKYVDFISANIDGFFNTANPNSLLVVNACSTLTRQLLRWYAFGEEFETGTITLKGRVGVGASGATIGSKLIECSPQGTETGKEFYIEGVLQQWQLGSPLITTLIVTRGHYPRNHVDNLGRIHAGRFQRVSKLCDDLHLTQHLFGNEEIFTSIEYPDDFEEDPRPYYISGESEE